MTNDQLLARLEHLENEVRQLRGAAAEPERDTTVSRRGLLRLGGAAAAGAAAALVGARPAAAAPSADGDVKLGGTFADNSAGAVMTQVQATVAADANDTGRATLYGYNTGSGQGIIGQSGGGGTGIWGLGLGTGGIGVRAEGTSAGLYLVPSGNASAPASGSHKRGELSVDSSGRLWICETSGSPGSWSRAITGAGTYTLGGRITLSSFGTPLGVFNAAPSGGPALYAEAPGGGPAIDAFGTGGTGVRTQGRIGVEAIGSAAPLYLRPQPSAGRPAANQNEVRLVGEILIDSTGSLYLCKDSGAPGFWARVGFNPMTTPFRLLDTRDSGGGGPLGPSERRSIDVGQEGPSGNALPHQALMHAVMLNVTAVPAVGHAASYFAVLPSDAPAIAAGDDAPYSNVNWAAGQLQANLVNVRVPGTGLIDVFNRHGNVHLVIDVLGFYS